MKTLYVSDLDGTLLRSDETLSDFTVQTINSLVGQGMLFSYATARSVLTASRVTSGLSCHFPVIVYNGAFITDSVTGDILLSNFFGDDVNDLLDDLIANNIYPIVYSIIDGRERYSFVAEKQTRGMKIFNSSRLGDPRENQKPLEKIGDLYLGQKFVLTCIDEPEKLEPMYHKYKDIYHCIFHRDIYSGEQWLEFLPKTTSKSSAIRGLKEYLHCDRLVVFGDGKNDIDMFRMADECYATENAVDELKQIATGIIGSNNRNGVAEWLLRNFSQETGRGSLPAAGYCI